MTLKVLNFIQKSFNRQCAISHFPGQVKVGTPSKFKKEIKDIIEDKYGKDYFKDQEYVVIATPKDVPFTQESKNKFARMITTVFCLTHDLDPVAIAEFGIFSKDEEDEIVAELEDPDENNVDDIDDDTKKTLNAKYLMMKVNIEI